MEEKKKYLITFTTLVDVNDEELLNISHTLWEGTSTFKMAQNKMYRYADKFEKHLKDFKVQMTDYSLIGSCEVSYEIMLKEDSRLIYEIRLQKKED